MRSGKQLVASRRNLAVTAVLENNRQMYEDEFGCCRKCTHNMTTLPNPCNDCVNGGGKNKHYLPRLKRDQNIKRM